MGTSIVHTGNVTSTYRFGTFQLHLTHKSGQEGKNWVVLTHYRFATHPSEGLDQKDGLLEAFHLF